MGAPEAIDHEYALSNAWEQAQRRLSLLETCHDPASRRRAAALGVGPGWRCLEAGAGHGSFARWLASQVGPRGHVVAADIDVGLLAGVEAPNVEVRQVDLAQDELPAGAFDFVHTRMVLMHIPARDAVLARLAAALRPGGVLMIEEHDIFPVHATASGPYRETWEVFERAMRAAGVDPEWARELPERLASLGLAEVDAELDVPLFPGGSAPAEFWSLTWLQARARVVAAGVPGGVIDRGRAALTDARRWFRGPAMVVAWGRAPARGGAAP